MFFNGRGCTGGAWLQYFCRIIARMYLITLAGCHAYKLANMIDYALSSWLKIHVHVPAGWLGGGLAWLAGRLVHVAAGERRGGSETSKAQHIELKAHAANIAR